MDLASLHPPLTAFPPVAFLVLLVVEAKQLVCRSRHLESAVAVLLWTGVLGTTAAFFSGYPASEVASQTFAVPDEVIAAHHSLGKLLLFLAWILAITYYTFRVALHHRAVFLAVYLCFVMLVAGCAVYTGYLGGELVFQHGAGVRATNLSP